MGTTTSARTPPRRSQGQFRTLEDKNLHELFGKFRGFIERRFAQLKISFEICKQTFRHHHNYFDILIQFCMAFDNYSETYAVGLTQIECAQLELEDSGISQIINQITTKFPESLLMRPFSAYILP